MQLLSSLDVRKKLGVMGVLFLFAVVFGAFMYGRLITASQITPGVQELKGLVAQQKLLLVHENLGNLWVHLTRAQLDESQKGTAESTTAALKQNWEDFKAELTALGQTQEQQDKLLQAIQGDFSYVLETVNDINTDFDDNFKTIFPKMAALSGGVSRISYLQQDPDQSVSFISSEVLKGYLTANALMREMQVIAIQAQGGNEDNIDRMEFLVSQTRLLKDPLFQWHQEETGKENPNVLQTNLKQNILPTDLDDFLGEAELFEADAAEEFVALGKQSIGQVDTYLKALFPLAQTEIERRLSGARTGRNFGLIIAVLFGLAFLAVGAFIGRDLVFGIDKALNVATAIARQGDLSVGERYTGKRADEIGDLLNEMSEMCAFLNNTATAAESIAAGNLKAADVKPKSEHDRMGKALEHMVVSLRNQIGETKANSAKVAETAKNILAATSQVAATANQMATSISEATTTAEEVRQTANLAEQKAKSVAQSAGEAASVSVVGQKKTQMTLDEMERIRKQMETIAESIVQLSEQGQAIGDIITTVNDLAEQSNVLAVNASIEAAKAGEHGRGFAVVAQEVKSLADESKTATAAVRAILSDIERATAAAVMLAEQGTKSAQASVDRSKEAGDSIKDLGTRVVQAAQSSAQISASASQQLAGVDQVVDAMVSIKDGSGQIVDSVNLVKTSAEELSQLSSALQENIQSYQV